MRVRRATECWLAGRRKACVEGTHRHMHARGVQLSLRLQAVEKRSPMRRKSKRCTCAPTQAILSAKEAAMGLCAKKGGWFEGSRTASISPRPPSPAVPHASSFSLRIQFAQICFKFRSMCAPHQISCIMTNTFVSLDTDVKQASLVAIVCKTVAWGALKRARACSAAKHSEII